MKKLILSLILVIGGAATAQAQLVTNTGAKELLGVVRQSSYIPTTTTEGTPVYNIVQNSFYEEHIAHLAVNDSSVIGNSTYRFIYVENLFIAVNSRGPNLHTVHIFEYDDIIEEPFK